MKWEVEQWRMVLFYNPKFFLLRADEQVSDTLCVRVFKCHLWFPLTSCFFSGRYAFHLWKPLGQAITETAKKISTSVSLEVTQYQLNLFICQIFRSKSFYDILCHFMPARFIFFPLDWSTPYSVCSVIYLVYF